MPPTRIYFPVLICAISPVIPRNLRQLLHPTIHHSLVGISVFRIDVSFSIMIAPDRTDEVHFHIFYALVFYRLCELDFPSLPSFLDHMPGNGGILHYAIVQTSIKFHSEVG